MGGDDPQPVQQPQIQTTAMTMSDYADNYPRLMALEQQYNPQQAALEYQIQSQYGPQYASLIKSVNESLYPQTAGLQEKLAGQAIEGMSGGVPTEMQQQYRDQLRAEVGDNAGSGIAGDYISRNMINQGEQYKNYYQNMALSLAGRQPLGTNSNAAYQNAGEGYNYAQVGNNNATNYGTYSSLYGSLANTNQSAANASTQGMYGLLGSGISAGGAIGAKMVPFMMCWVASEIFGGWTNHNTMKARYYVVNQAPSWFRKLYARFGQRVANFISNKPILKNILKPLFEYFVRKSEGEL